MIGELLQRAASKVDQAAVYVLNVSLMFVKSENRASRGQRAQRACDCSASICPHIRPGSRSRPSTRRSGSTLDGRPIESLIDLPLMTDPELQAAMRLLSALTPPAGYFDHHLHFLLICRMVNVEHAAWDERRFRTRLFPSRDDPRPGVSPLPGGASFRQPRLRPRREAWLRRLRERKSTRRRESPRSGPSRSRPRSIS